MRVDHTQIELPEPALDVEIAKILLVKQFFFRVKMVTSCFLARCAFEIFILFESLNLLNRIKIVPLKRGF